MSTRSPAVTTVYYLVIIIAVINAANAVHVVYVAAVIIRNHNSVVDVVVVIVTDGEVGVGSKLRSSTDNAAIRRQLVGLHWRVNIVTIVVIIVAVIHCDVGFDVLWRSAGYLWQLLLIRCPFFQSI